MSEYTSRVQTIEKVADKILFKGKIPKSSYMLVLELIIDGYRDLRLGNGANGVKQTRKTPNDINCIDFPTDMERFIGVAVPISGKMLFLTEDKSIVLTTTTSEGSEIQDSSKGEGVALPKATPNALYSTGGRNLSGYFVLDHENRRIMLNGVSKTEVILVYVTSGTKVDGETTIEARCVPAIEAYVHLHLNRYNTNLAVHQKQFLQQTYNQEITRLKGMNLSFRSLINSIRKTYKILPK